MFTSSRKVMLAFACMAVLTLAAAIPHNTSAAFEFHNVIKSEGQCGLNNTGHMDKLVNTDTAKKYKVTINIEWSDGSETGAYQKAMVNLPGATLDLGCSIEGAKAPATKYVRTVLSEGKP